MKGVAARELKGVRIVAFHGTSDNTYERGYSEGMSLANNGVNLKFYTLKLAGHAIQPIVFDEYNTIEWMIAQSRQIM